MKNLIDQFHSVVAYVYIAQRDAKEFADKDRLGNVQEEIDALAEIIGVDKPVWP